jgi:hypothetical protein
VTGVQIGERPVFLEIEVLNYTARGEAVFSGYRGA